MATVKYIQTRDPDTQTLSAKYLLEVVAENVIFEDENLTLPQKMDTKSDKSIYGDLIVSKGRLENSTVGQGSFAFGKDVSAIGENSTALGKSTYAVSPESVTTGRYNLYDYEGRYALTIGNGFQDAETELITRSNAFMVDWNGNVYANKFVNLEGEEALTSLKSIQVGDKDYELHGSKLHLVAGHNIRLSPIEIEGENPDGTKSHTLQVTITAGEGISGDGSGEGIGGLYLPLIGGTVYGPVVFNTVYDRSKFTDAEKEVFIKNSPNYKPGMTDEEKEELLYSMSYMPIVLGDPENGHLNIDYEIGGANISAYNEHTAKGENLYLNKTKGKVIIGNSEKSSIVFDPKRNAGGTGISINTIGNKSFGWGGDVSPTGQNSIAFGNGTRAGGAFSFAEGDTTRASGIASHAEGIHTSATATGSHAEGSYTYAKGAYSHTEGLGVVINGLYSHSEGYGENHSLINTYFTARTDKEEIVEYYNKIKRFAYLRGDYSHSEGKNNIGLDDFSHLEGEENFAYDRYNHLEGYGNYSKGDYDHLDGFSNINEGNHNFISGYMNTIQGHNSKILGKMNKLKGSNSVILGTDNQNEGDFLFTIGQSNKIKSNNMIVLGTDINSSGQQTTNSQRDFQFIAGSNIGANNTEGTFILGRNSSTLGNSNSHIIGFNSTILHNHNSLIFAKNASISNFNSSVVFGLNISAIRPGTNDNNFIYVDEIENFYIGNTFYRNTLLAHKLQFYINNTEDNIIIGNDLTLGDSQNSIFKFINNIILGNSHIVKIDEEIAAAGSIVNSTIIGYANTILPYQEINSLYMEGHHNTIDRNGVISGHIEGDENIVKTTAIYDSGSFHIEGTNNYLDNYYGQGTHIEGYFNTAETGSHAEGSNIEARGLFNHGEGYYTFTKGKIYEDYDLSEGEIDIISSYNHIEGRGSISTGNFSHVEGGVLTDEILNKEDYLAIFKDTSWPIKIIQFQLENNYKYHLNCGNYNHLEGIQNLILSDFTHTEGAYNINKMNHSHLEGFYNYIENNIFQSSHIEGYKLFVFNDSYSHIEGYSQFDYNIDNIKEILSIEDTSSQKNKIFKPLFENWISNPYFISVFSLGNHEEGINNLAFLSNYTHVEGSNNITFNAEKVHIEGINNFTKGLGNHSEGYDNINLGTYSHIEGCGNEYIASNYDSLTYELWQEHHFALVKGKASHVEGGECWGEGNYSHAEGFRNASIGIAAHAEGKQTIAKGDYSHSQGELTNSIGYASFTAGYGNNAIGQYSIAFGKNTQANADYSFTFGEGTIASSQYQMALGQYNEPNEDAYIIVGNGKADDRRNTIFEVSKTGVVKAGGFQTLDGSPIGGGSEMPIGTIITNQNPYKSGFEFGEWKCLGKQILTLLDENDNPIEVKTYYWQRVEHYIEPEDGEKYFIIGSELSDDDTYTIIGTEINPGETFLREKGGNN